MNAQDFDCERLERLKKALAKAEKANAESFNFDGHLLLTTYAKYLVEYLEGQLRT